MKLIGLIIFVFIPLFLFAQQQYSIHDLKSGKFKADTSYIYQLPFSKHKKVFLIQAYESNLSHKGEVALDFKIGGLKPENLSDGNFISIQHSDGSVAHYWHLQKEGALAKVGDVVVKGQLIGLSGNTGYSAFPHLHFEVNQNGKQIPTRFQTKKGAKYLRPSKFYRAV